MTRVTGTAHGWWLYDNVLELDRDDHSRTSLPITVLVEEGKHASAPDRNGDGAYTPGFDVNRRIDDSWGVRDTLRGGRMVAARYNASMTKVRFPSDRIGPATSLDADVLFASYQPRKRLGEPVAHYELLQLPSSEDCVELGKQRLAKALFLGFAFDLCSALIRAHSGEVLPQDRVPGKLWTPFRTILDVFGASATYDPLVSKILWRISGATQAPGVGGWITFSGATTSGVQHDGRVLFIGWPGKLDESAHEIALGYSPSASRWADWYAEVVLRRRTVAVPNPTSQKYVYWRTPEDVRLGPAELERPVPAGFAVEPIEETVNVADPERSVRIEYEAGYRFRFKVGPFPTHFGAGIRLNNLRAIGDTRLVLSVGLGPW